MLYLYGTDDVLCCTTVRSVVRFKWEAYGYARWQRSACLSVSFYVLFLLYTLGTALELGRVVTDHNARAAFRPPPCDNEEVCSLACTRA